MDGTLSILSLFLGRSFRTLARLDSLQLQILVAEIKGQAPEKIHRGDILRAKSDPPIHTCISEMCGKCPRY